MKLIVEDEDGGRTVVPFARGELSIGRQEGNAVRLEARNVSRRHARLVRSNGTVMVEDLGSFNGVRVNGEAIRGKVAVHEGDQIAIGDYNLAIEAEDLAQDAQASDPFPSSPADDGRNIRTAVIQAPPELARSPGSIPLRPGDRPSLLRLDGGGDPLEVMGSDVIIGRDAGESDLVLDHRSISRRHARLWLDPDASWHVSDLNSINGLRVNGEVYRESPLRPGDEVELGHVRLRFLPPGARAVSAEAGAAQWPARWMLIAGLVALVATAEFLRWNGSLSRVAPYFGAQSSKPQNALPPPEPVAEPEPSAAPPVAPAAPALQPAAAPEPQPAIVERRVVTIPSRHIEVASRTRSPQPARGAVAADAVGAPTAPDPARAAQAYDDAISLINSSDFQDALAKLHQALQWNPQLAEAHKAMGICFANLHQPDKGAFHYEQYLKLRPQASDAADVRRLLSDYYRTLPDRAASPVAPGSAPP